MTVDVIREAGCPLPCAGFEAGAQGRAAQRVMPQCVRLAVPEGRWRVRVRITAQADAPQALLFGNHRRLLWRGALRAGESADVETACLLAPSLPEGADEPVPCPGLELALLAPQARIAQVTAEPAALPAVFLMGDSTVTDQPSPAPYAPGATYGGWGQMLPAWLGATACVGNFARSGLTTETFRAEGCYDVMRPLLAPGDLVLLQFGHNDQKRASLMAEGGYARALHTYLDELRALGARPVIVTPLARNSWWDSARYDDLLLPFAEAGLRVAARAGAPAIDLHAWMRGKLEAAGREAMKPLYHIGDYTHTNDFGAYAAAGFIAGELARLGLAAPAALPAWPPQGPYTVLTAERIDEASPAPEAACAGAGDAGALLTRLDALELACRSAGLFACNTPQALPEDVPPCEPYTQTVCCALQSGLVPEDFLADGRLHRLRPIALEDFLRVLMRAWGMRCPLTPAGETPPGVSPRAQEAVRCAVGMGLTDDRADYAAHVTRGQAEAICRNIVI